MIRKLNPRKVVGLFLTESSELVAESQDVDADDNEENADQNAD